MLETIRTIIEIIFFFSLAGLCIMGISCIKFHLSNAKEARNEKIWNNAIKNAFRKCEGVKYEKFE